MEKIKKALNSKILLLTIASVFLLNTITYGIDISEKSKLRKLSDFNGGGSTQRYRDAYKRIITRGSFLAAIVGMTLTAKGQITATSANQERINTLINKALADPNEIVRANAAYALGEFKDPRAFDTLINTALADPSEMVRDRAGEALEKLKDPRTFDTLINTALTDPDGEVRFKALHALRVLTDPSPKVIDALINKALAYPSESVRREAAKALRENTNLRDFDVLFEALTYTSENFRAIYVLRRFKDQRVVVDTLINKADDPSERVRLKAVYVLGELEDPRAFDTLVKALADPYVEVRRNAAKALGKLKDLRVFDALIKALTDPSASVRREAAKALGELSVALDEQHPYKKLLSCFKSRIEDIKEGGFSPYNVFLIYRNQEFRKQTDNIHMVHQFSLARGIENILTRFNKEVNDKNIEIALPFVLEAWKSQGERLVVNKDSHVIASFHIESKSFSGKFAKLLHDQFGINTQDPNVFCSFEGSFDNEELRKAKEGLRKKIEDPYYDVLYFEHHGGTRHLWFTSGQIGSQESDELHVPNALNYKELAENLYNRAKNNQGKLSDLTIIISACYSADFAVNVLNELAGFLANGQIKDLPAITTSTNRGTIAFKFLGGPIQFMINVSEGKENMHWSDFYQVEILAWNQQQMAFFLFIPQEKLNALKEALGVQGKFIAPADKKGAGEHMPQAIPEQVLPLGSPHDPGEGEIVPLKPALPVINVQNQKIALPPGRDIPGEGFSLPSAPVLMAVSAMRLVIGNPVFSRRALFTIGSSL